MWSNLAVTLWQGRCQLSDLELRRETLRRIARAWDLVMGTRFPARCSAERMESLASLPQQRQIPEPTPKKLVPTH